MSIKFSLIGLFTLMTYFSQAQVVSDVRPPADGVIGEFTEWKEVDVKFEDGTTGKIAYRIALAGRKGIACNYDLEVHNKSDIKLSVKMKSSYFDKLVKSNFGDEIKSSIKPDKSAVARFIAQGCKKAKDAETDDFGTCLACDFGIDIYVSK